MRSGDLPTPRVLREYALVADGERGAVIGPDGSVLYDLLGRQARGPHPPPGGG